MASSKISIPWRRISDKPPYLLSLLKIGFVPAIQDFNKFMVFLFQTQRFQCIINLFSQMNSNQIKVDSQTLKIFTKALLREQKYEEVFRFLRTNVGATNILNKNRIFDTLVQEYCRNENDPEKGLVVLRDFLGVDGMVPSSFTFCSLIDGFSSQGKMDRVIEVLELMTCERVNYPFDNFVCSSVISGFLRIGKPELAFEFYENAVNSNVLNVNVVTYTALLSAYLMLGRIEEVSNMVARMDKKGLSFDVVFYTNWICGYFKEGMIQEAFRKYREMIDRRLEMDTVAYTVIIDGISKEENVEKAVGILSKMIKTGSRPNIVTFTALMLGFSKKGKLQEAFALFKMIEAFGIKADEFSYAVLIDGFCRRADFDGVFRLLDEMETKGIKPSVVTYNIVINGLCKAGRTSEADDFSKSIAGDVFTYSTLLHGYVVEDNTLGMLEIKARFEAAGICMDVVMCNVLIKALFMMGLFEDGLAIYRGMQEMDLAATTVTYCTLINGYCKAGRLNEAIEVFNEFRMTSKPTDADYECIINGLCKRGIVDMAVEAFIELVQRSFPLNKMLCMRLVITTYNAKGAEGVYFLIHRMKDIGGEPFCILGNYAISFLFKKNFSDIIVDLLLMMIINGSFVTSKSYYLVLRNLLRDGESLFTQIIFTMFLKQYGMDEPRVSGIMVNYMCMRNPKNALKFVHNLHGKSGITFTLSALQTLSKYGRVQDTYELLMVAKDKQHDTDLLTYYSIIDVLCKEGHLSKAVELCGFVQKKGISLSIAAYDMIMKELFHQGCFVEALRLFDSLEKINMFPSETTFSILIHSLSKEGFLADARRMLDSMSRKNMKPSIRVFNSLIYGYCKLGQIPEALKLLFDLEVVNLKPDEFTMSAVIYGYCQKGDTEGALQFFSEFKSKEKSPDFLGFMYLIKSLITKGRMEESQSILREMLQNRSVIDILNRIVTRNKMESAHGLLVILCERGKIQEAISILDEVGSWCFPVRRRFISTDTCKKHESCDMNLRETSKFEPSIFTRDACIATVCNDDELEATSKPMYEKISKSLNVNSSYAYIASLCSKGDISKANKLVKMISGFL